MSVESLFLQFSAEKLRQFADRIGVCLGKLNEDQLWARGGENENAIGNLALHLAGNVCQWILSALGGDPFKRDRDGEFAARGGFTAADLSAKLRDTVDQAAKIISALTTAQLTQRYEIQNYHVSGVEAVYHVVEHFAEHTGQIIFATKMLTGDDMGFYRHLGIPRIGNLCRKRYDFSRYHTRSEENVRSSRADCRPLRRAAVTSLPDSVRPASLGAAGPFPDFRYNTSRADGKCAPEVAGAVSAGLVPLAR